MEHEAARSKRVDPDALPSRAPMKQGDKPDAPKINRAPSTDQKKVRRQQARTATVLDTHAERLQPGDRVLGPTGQTVTVKRVRNHETSSNHLYLETDAGNSLVERKQQFRLAPHNTTQQEVPGFGIPGANTNTNPFGRDHGHGPSNQVGSTTCPNCGRNGTMSRKGGQYVCSNCGYHEQSGPLGQGVTLMDTDRVIRSFNSLDRAPSAIARRAREVLGIQEETP